MTGPLDILPADLDTLRAQAAGCTRCELHEHATATVFSAGPARARPVLVGEQPAVKHFTFRYRGKRRIHETPEAGHIRACRPWLDAELAPVRPTIHPSAILRADDEDAREEMFTGFVADPRVAGELLAG